MQSWFWSLDSLCCSSMECPVLVSMTKNCFFHIWVSIAVTYCNWKLWIGCQDLNLWSHANLYPWKSTYSLIQLICQPSGTMPISSHQRIIISYITQRELIDTTIIHLPYSNFNLTLGSLRIHYVIQLIVRILQHADEFRIQ